MINSQCYKKSIYEILDYLRHNDIDMLYSYNIGDKRVAG